VFFLFADGSIIIQQEQIRSGTSFGIYDYALPTTIYYKELLTSLILPTLLLKKYYI